MLDLSKNYFSMFAGRMKKSVIRELLKLTENPEIISFAGGFPAPDHFPLEELKEIAASLIMEKGQSVLQYGGTDGYGPLKEELVKLALADNIKVSSENIIVTVASQQALDLVGKIFINPGDNILVELPSYLGGLQAFGAYGANMDGVPLDNDGIRVDILEEKLKKAKSEGKQYKFLYVIPDFHNPAGVTLNTERRKKIIELSHEYNFLIIEDSPYRGIRFEGDAPPSMQSLDPLGNVISLYTFSKILVPGLRLGWVIAHKDIIDKLNVAKQPSDLCTPPFCQAIAGEFCRKGLLPPHINKIRGVYKRKKDLMLKALDDYMPKNVGISWTKPEGGLFLWITLPEYMDAEKLFPKAIEQKVAYIIGNAFACDGKCQNTIRLNFSFPKEEIIEEGIKRLSKVIKDAIV